MSEPRTEESLKSLVFEYEIDAPPRKVWRAIRISAFRDKWLPKEALADPEAFSITPGREVRYRMREAAPPFLESTVTFRIAPNDAGGTSLQIVHELADARFDRMVRAAANSNSPPLMLAA